MEIELREHAYEKKTLLGTRKRAFAQRWVFAKNEDTGKLVQVGLIGNAPDAKFCPTIHDLDQGLIDEIQAAISAKLEREVQSAAAPVSPDRAEPPLEIEEDDDE